MIPMSCPSCGRKGNVPLDRLNTRMHCKKCDAVFHLDASGKPMLGEPPAAKGSKAARNARGKNEPLDPIGIVAAKLAKTPKPIWMTLAGVCVLFVLWKAVGLIGPRQTSPNENFAQRNFDAAMAFLNGDSATLSSMATVDSRDEMVKVVETFRPLVGDKAGKGAEDMKPVPVLPEEMTDEPHVEISIQPPQAPGAEEASPIFYLDLYWIKGKNNYVINGKLTLEAMEGREKLRKELEARNK